MKKYFTTPFFLVVSVLLFTFTFNNCSDSNSNPTGGGLGGDGDGGGGGTGNVTFTVSTTQGQQGTIFQFQPSTDVTVTTVTVNLPAQQFTDAITNPNPNEVYTTNDGFQVGEYTGVQSGQQWNFNIVGKIGSATGTAYNVTVNYTIP